MSGDDARALAAARVAGALADHGWVGPAPVNAVMRSAVDGVLGELEEARAAVERAVALRDEARGERDALRAELEEARADAERLTAERVATVERMSEQTARLKQAEEERDTLRAAGTRLVSRPDELGGEPAELPGDGYAPRHARRGGVSALADRARDTAVALEQECARLEGELAVLRDHVNWLGESEYVEVGISGDVTHAAVRDPGRVPVGPPGDAPMFMPRGLRECHAAGYHLDVHAATTEAGNVHRVCTHCGTHLRRRQIRRGAADVAYGGDT